MSIHLLVCLKIIILCSYMHIIKYGMLNKLILLSFVACQVLACWLLMMCVFVFSQTIKRETP